MSGGRCTACGAELRFGPTRCPLCGSDLAKKTPEPKRKGSTERYQADVRTLREQLKKLRHEGAEAV